MSYEDRALTCVQCNKEFTFTKGEQEFYEQKGFTAEPKRCKACRTSRKRGNKQQGAGIYRSPAFENSAPSHQRIRNGRNNPRRSRGRGDYRSPASYGSRSGSRDYRSPAFRENEKLNPEQEYRSPGFREYAELKPEEEYRAPGFKEHAELDLKEEYRAPAYRELSKQYQDEKPLFEISCKRCGELAMVPFFPEEKEEVYCQECYALVRAENAAMEKQQAERAEVKVSDFDDTTTDEVQSGEGQFSTQEVDGAE